MALLTEDFIKELDEDITTEQAAAILESQGELSEVAARMGEDLVDCYQLLTNANVSMRKSYIEIEHAFRQYLIDLRVTIAQFPIAGLSTAYDSAVGYESQPAEEYKFLDTTTPGFQLWMKEKYRNEVVTPALLHVFEDPGDDLVYWSQQVKALTTLVRNMHEMATVFGAPLTAQVKLDNSANWGSGDNMLGDVRSAVDSSTYVTENNARQTARGQPVAPNIHVLVVNTRTDYAGMIEWGDEVYIGTEDLKHRDSAKISHYPADKGTPTEISTFSKARGNLTSTPSSGAGTPPQPAFYYFTRSNQFDELRSNPNSRDESTIIDGLILNYVRNQATMDQHVNMPDLPVGLASFEDQQTNAFKQNPMVTSAPGLVDMDNVNLHIPHRSHAEKSLLSWTHELSTADAKAGSPSPDSDDVKDYAFVPASQKNLLRTWGTFKQMFDTYKLMVDSVRFDRDYSDGLTESTGLFKIAGAAFISSQRDLLTAWNCVREAIKPYTDKLHEFKALTKDVLDKADVQISDLLGWFGDGVNNADMAAMAGRIDSVSAVTRISAAVQRNIFKEQCFLLSYMKRLSDVKKDRDQTSNSAIPWAPGEEPKKMLPYEGHLYNSSLLLDGDPYGLINKLTQGKGSTAFFNVDSKVISHLQPMIRLYKVTYDEEGKAYEDEFIFESSAVGLEAMLQNRPRRGAGVGVQSFDFAYEGSNPFAVKKSISATLKVFASSMDELLLARKSKNDRDISFADLALKTRNPTQSQQPGQNPAACGTANQSNRLRTAQNANLDKLTFRLKAVVGWATPNGNGPWTIMDNPTSTTQDSKELLYKGIWDSSITLNLTPTVHSFEFDDLGRTVMSIKYLAYVDDFYDQPAYNVFANPNSGDSPTAKQMVRNMALEYYTENCDTEKLAMVKANIAKNVNSEKQEVLQALVSSLASQEKIYTLHLANSGIGLFLSEGPFQQWDFNNPPFDLDFANDTSSDTAATEMAEAIASYDGFTKENTDNNSDTNLFRSGLAATSPDKETLPFIFVSDLIDCIMENIEKEIVNLPTDLETEMLATETEMGLNDRCRIEEEKQRLIRLRESYKKLRIVLGPIEVVDQSENSPSNILHCTFGDIPIALKYFLEWMTEQMTGQRQTIYSLTRFASDLFNKLIQDFLNDGSCFNWDIKPGGKIRMNQTVITSYPTTGAQNTPLVDEITQQIKALTPTGTRINVANMTTPVFRISGVENTPIAAGLVSEEMNYFIFFAGRVAPINQMNGDKAADEAKGIYHYMIGREKGLIKNIKLNKTDSTGLAEVRFEQEGYEGLQQLRVLYDADIEMYANVKTFPGTYIFVDPRGFAPTTNLDCGDPLNLTQYGLGGYMMIIKSEHSFGPGKAETKLQAKWVNGISNCTGTQDSNLGQQGTANPTNNSSTGQCNGTLTQARIDSATDATPAAVPPPTTTNP